MSDSGKAVFLSYASQDAAAAKRICDALRAAGIEVWFDQSELGGGDAWDTKIRKQIKECALFVPIISPATNARAEGYFRREWKQAVERTHDMADDVPFLFPIVIGDIKDATARVPDKFREVQWTRLRLDETPGDLAGRVAKLLNAGSWVGGVLHPDSFTPSGHKAPIREILLQLAVVDDLPDPRHHHGPDVRRRAAGENDAGAVRQTTGPRPGAGACGGDRSPDSGLRHACGAAVRGAHARGQSVGTAQQNGYGAG